jgi:hypothetical protein
LLTRAVHVLKARPAVAKCAADAVVRRRSTLRAILRMHLAAESVVAPSVIDRFARPLPAALEQCRIRRG